MLLDDLRSAILLKNSTPRTHLHLHSHQQKSDICSAMHSSNATARVQDERQTLLSDISRIRAHGSYPDTFAKDPLAMAFSGMQGALQGARATAQDTLGWLRQALRDPDDFTSAAVGRMVSKAYGKHERPHTEHHLLRSGASPRTSPPNSPLASSAPTAAAHTVPAGQQLQDSTYRSLQDSSESHVSSQTVDDGLQEGSRASGVTRFEFGAAAGQSAGQERVQGDGKQYMTGGGGGGGGGGYEVLQGGAAGSDDTQHLMGRDQSDM